MSVDKTIPDWLTLSKKDKQFACGGTKWEIEFTNVQREERNHFLLDF